MAHTDERPKNTAPRPGDQAPEGTLGTGEVVCPRCRGTGRLDNLVCPNCEGTGVVVIGIGGA